MSTWHFNGFLLLKFWKILPLAYFSLLHLMISSRYKLLSEIDSGRYAHVFHCEDESTGRSFAAKVLDKSMEINKEAYEAEVSALRICSHQGIIEYIDAYETENEYIIIVEECDYSMYDYVKKNNGMSEDMIIKSFYPVFQALKYIHSMNIIHNDIKLDNIVFKKSLNECKLVDFGYSEVIDSGYSLRKVGSTYYTAPEILMNKKHDFKADIWALGISLYAAATGSFPFDASSAYHYLCSELTDEPDLAKLESLNFSENFINLIIMMLTKNIDSRPQIIDCLKHPVFPTEIKQNTCY